MSFRSDREPPSWDFEPEILFDHDNGNPVIHDRRESRLQLGLSLRQGADADLVIVRTGRIGHRGWESCATDRGKVLQQCHGRGSLSARGVWLKKGPERDAV